MLVRVKDKINIEKPKSKIGLKCFLCGRVATEEHHIFYGRGKRKISDREGLTVALCRLCHWKIHNNHKEDKDLKQLAQKVWLEKNNNDRKKWYQMFMRFWEK